MRVALLGASGRTGRVVADRLRAAGHGLAVLVRDPGRLEDAAGRVVTVGDARDPGAVRAVLVNADAAVSCLGMRDITLAAADLSDATACLVRVMEDHGPSRLVAMAAAGALPHPAGGMRSEHGGPELLRHVAVEHRRIVACLMASRLDWTLLCPGNLVVEASPRYATAVEDWPEGGRVTGYGHIADAILHALDTGEWGRKRIGIAAVEG